MSNSIKNLKFYIAHSKKLLADTVTPNNSKDFTEMLKYLTKVEMILARQEEKANVG